MVSALEKVRPLERQPVRTLERELSGDALARLQAFLGRVNAGTLKDFRTKIYQDIDRSQVLEDIQSFAIPSGYEEFDTLEYAASKKFGSFSFRLPYDQVKGKVHGYFEPKRWDISDAVYSMAWQRLASILLPGTLRSSSLKNAFDSAPKGTNWGLPYFTSDKEVYPKYLSDAEEQQRSGWEQGELWPCVLGVRSQPNGIGEPSKWRPLWMAGHASTLAELSVQQPLIAALVKLPRHVAWSTPDRIALQITHMLKSRPRLKWFSTDMSHYDLSLTGQIVHGVFDLLRYWFVREDHKLIDWLEYLFRNVSIVTPEGILSGMDHGVASGLGMTNIMDTLAQELMDEIIAVMTDSTVEGIYLGDDGSKRFIGGEVTPESYAELYSKMNMVVSVDKSMYSEDMIDFLQRRHSINYQVGGICVGYRSLIRTGVGVISYETHRFLSPAMLAIRAVQQIEQCSGDTNFREMVNWLFLGDEYLRTRGPLQALVDAGGVDRVKEVLKYRSYPYNQRDVSQFRNFKTVQILEELRTFDSVAGLAS